MNKTDERNLPFSKAHMDEISRREIVSTLKDDGFTEEQLNSMPSERVWKLFLNNKLKIVNDEFSSLCRQFEPVRDVSPRFEPLVNAFLEKFTEGMNKIAESLEKELDKKERRKKQ